MGTPNKVPLILGNPPYRAKKSKSSTASGFVIYSVGYIGTCLIKAARDFCLGKQNNEQVEIQCLDRQASESSMVSVLGLVPIERQDHFLQRYAEVSMSGLETVRFIHRNSRLEFVLDSSLTSLWPILILRLIFMKVDIRLIRSMSMGVFSMRSLWVCAANADFLSANHIQKRLQHLVWEYTPIMETQIGNNMEHEMDTGNIMGSIEAILHRPTLNPKP